MKTLRSALAAALAVSLSAAPAAANPSLSYDFANMSQWLSHQMAQGLAFNAGETFDPPHEVKGYALQPDLSIGVGRMPFNKTDFPTITTPALADLPAPNLFPNAVLFPNFAMHLRMGLPWRGDAYLRFADATTPPGYKISPTMTAKVQTNSFGFGIRQHFFGGPELEDWPRLTLGAHYNHVQGYTNLNGKFLVNTNGFTADSPFLGKIAWNLNSYALTAVLSKTFDRWTPYAGLGYNYATGSVGVDLHLVSATFLVQDVYGSGSDHPEKSQGREMFGFSYERETWSAFADAELKALGELQYRSFIVSAGVALPFDIGRGPKIFYKRLPGGATPMSLRKNKADDADQVAPSSDSTTRAIQSYPKAPRWGDEKPKPAPTTEQAPPDMIFLK